MNQLTPMTGNDHITDIRWWHEQIVDIMLLFPHWTQGEIATHFGKTDSWVSTIINSNVFQAYYKQRMAEHHAAISGGIKDRLEDVAILSLDVMKEKLSEARNELSLGQVRESSEMALRSLGFGGKVVNGGAPQNGNPAILMNFGEGSNVSIEGMLADLDKKKAESQEKQKEASPSPKTIDQKDYSVIEDDEPELPFDA